MTAIDSVEDRGQVIYEEQLRAKLEVDHLGEAIAIHVLSGDYVIHRNRSKAVMELLKRHNDGQIYSRHIGPPTPSEISLATLLRGQDTTGQGEKS